MQNQDDIRNLPIDIAFTRLGGRKIWSKKKIIQICISMCIYSFLNFLGN